MAIEKELLDFEEKLIKELEVSNIDEAILVLRERIGKREIATN